MSNDAILFWVKNWNIDASDIKLRNIYCKFSKSSLMYTV